MQTTKKRRIALAGVTQFFRPENASVVCFISIVQVYPKKEPGFGPAFFQKSYFKVIIA